MPEQLTECRTVHLQLTTVTLRLNIGANEGVALVVHAIHLQQLLFPYIASQQLPVFHNAGGISAAYAGNHLPSGGIALVQRDGLPCGQLLTYRKGFIVASRISPISGFFITAIGFSRGSPSLHILSPGIIA